MNTKFLYVSSLYETLLCVCCCHVYLLCIVARESLCISYCRFMLDSRPAGQDPNPKLPEYDAG